MEKQLTGVVASASSAAIVAAVAVLACSSDPAAPEEYTLRGPEVAVGAGLARTELVFDAADQVQSVSVVFTPGALQNLPETLPNTEFIVPLPAQAPALVFDHIGINWQPQGHPPPMVYTRPHFDVHYYLVSMAERDAMTPADPEFAAKSARAPDPDEAPPGYAGDPFGIPRMGSHWTDQASHEFHGQQFTNTLVYGFYDGTMVFLEPMMTAAYLETRPDETSQIRVPARFPEPGRYPTSYRVRYDEAAGEYRVELLGFVGRA